MSALHFLVSSINFVSVLAFFSEIQIAEKLADSLVVPGRHDDLADRSEIIQQMMHQALPYALALIIRCNEQILNVNDRCIVA